MPLTLWALLALLLHAAIVLFDISYDDGGLGSLLILSSPVWGFMYWLPSELLFALNQGHAIPGQSWIVGALGLVIAVLMGLMIWWLRHRRQSTGADPLGTSHGLEP